jgi:lipid II:glycine glycyltransferase (peptidoglycan interpeptide bridge formation enzyme)
MLGPDWQIEVDGSSPAEWSAMLNLFNDANIYQTHSYGAIRWGAKNLSHLVLKRGGDVVAIAQLRIVRPTRFKFGMAYLRWGPLFERRGRPLDPEVAEAVAHALENEYGRRRKLYLRVLPNAFTGSPRATLVQAAFASFTGEPPSGENTDRTLLLDLSPSLDELRRRFDKKWRNQLSRAEKNNLTVAGGTGSEEYRTFARLYQEMRRRKTFETTVDAEEFGRIQADLPEPLRMRVLICMSQGVPVAGLVAAPMGDSAIYVLGATGDDGLNSKGAYLLQWTLISWLKENGYRWYDLGGIDPKRNPGVYHFKSGLSGADACRLSPFVACSSAASSAVVRAGLAVRRIMEAARMHSTSRVPVSP